MPRPYLPRSRARFEEPVCIANRTRGALARSADAELESDEERDDYGDFYEGHAFDTLYFSCDGELLTDHFLQPPVGYEEYDSVPDAILDDRAFYSGFFSAPFDFVVSGYGNIRARNLSPDITIRDLSASLVAAVEARKKEDGWWNADSSLKVENEDAMAMAKAFVATTHWGGPAEEVSFYDKYWRQRSYVQGYNIDSGSSQGGGLIYVSSWGS